MMLENERLFVTFTLGDEDMAITKRGNEWIVHECFDGSSGKGAAMKHFCDVFRAWDYVWMLSQASVIAEDITF